VESRAHKEQKNIYRFVLKKKKVGSEPSLSWTVLEFTSESCWPCLKLEKLMLDDCNKTDIKKRKKDKKKEKKKKKKKKRKRKKEKEKGKKGNAASI